jgi:proline iminopeptidase
MAHNGLVVVAPTARLAVYDRGGDGEPILFLHGGPGCPDYLGPVAEMLPPKYRVIRFDQRGVGQSVALNERYGIEDYLSDVGAIRTYFALETMHVFGHSWGGLLAQLYAGQQPERVRSLCLCSPALGVGADWKRSERAVVAYNLKKSGWARSLLLALWSLTLKLPGHLGKLAARNIYATGWRNAFVDPRNAFPPDPLWLDGVNGEALEKTSRALAAANPAVFPHPKAPPTWPVLIVSGKPGYDMFAANMDMVYARFPTARRVVLLNSGHLPWIQDREAFQKALARFYA